MQDWKLEPARDHGLSLHQQLASARREGGLINAVTHLLGSAVIGLYLKIAHRVVIDGRDNLPKTGPFVLIANHSSHLDALVLASSIPWRLRDRIFPIAAGDTFFSSPLMGILTVLMINALPMWRRRSTGHALADLRERLSQDQCIFIIFPEGTRSRTGEMGQFKAGLGMLVASTNVPVIPCRLLGAYEALPCHRRFPRPLKVHLRIGKPLSFEDFPNDREGWQRVASETQTAVRDLALPRAAK